MAKTEEDHLDDQGASLEELLFEACRRDNVDLLDEVLNADECTIELLNEARRGGDAALHAAVQASSVGVLRELLTVEGIEFDPINMRGYSPLHSAVMYALDKDDQYEIGLDMVELLVHAGADLNLKATAKNDPDTPLEKAKRNEKRAPKLFQLMNTMNITKQVARDHVLPEDEPSEGDSGSESDN